MPEAPELEVIVEFLRDRVIGTGVTSATVIKPSVLRSLHGDMGLDAPGRSITVVQRRGKFVLLSLSGDRLLAINPMLTGALQYCSPADRLFKRTCIVLSLSNGCELRYLDERQMGAVYYLRQDQFGQLPRIAEQGPDVLDDTSFQEFQRLLRTSPGEIKGILTRGKVIAGIGNAYSDEILFAARIYPFRKRKSLTENELSRLFESCRAVVLEAILAVKERMGVKIHTKPRDFLKVHNRGGLPCPRCGHTISQVTANKRITSYCRRCQPGMLIKN